MSSEYYLYERSLWVLASPICTPYAESIGFSSATFAEVQSYCAAQLKLLPILKFSEADVVHTDGLVRSAKNKNPYNLYVWGREILSENSPWFLLYANGERAFPWISSPQVRGLLKQAEASARLARADIMKSKEFIELEDMECPPAEGRIDFPGPLGDLSREEMHSCLTGYIGGCWLVNATRRATLQYTKSMPDTLRQDAEKFFATLRCDGAALFELTRSAYF